MSVPLHVLVIAYVWPEPSSSAAGSHLLSILTEFQAQNCTITIASPAQATEQMADLASLGIERKEVLLNDSSFDDYVKDLQPDIVLFDRFMMEEQFGWRVEKACPSAMRILDTEDLFCLRHARHDQHKKQLANEKQSGEAVPISASVNRELLFTELAQREIASIYRCDLSLIISEVELEILIDMFKIDPALLIYFPLQGKKLSTIEQQTNLGFLDRQHFISIGNFRHPPNWDAVLWLKNSVWPEIRKHLPAANLNIYGAYTPPKAMALHNPKQGFLIHGWVEDANTVMSNARVNMAAVRFGAGLKGKILDAMRCGTPSITSPIGAEGISGDDTFPGSIADNAADIAKQAITLYSDKEKWLQAQHLGFSMFNERFSAGLFSESLMARIEQTRHSLQDHRLNNFTGAMMRHHVHKSTQYMGQWIEEKNKHR